MDQSEIDEDWNLGHFIAVYGWMDSLPDEGKDEGDDNDHPSTTCKPKTLPNAFDGPNSDECNDSQPFSEKQAYKSVAREFCRGDWNFEAQVGSKDTRKWSATLDMFTDSVQTDPDTKLPLFAPLGIKCGKPSKRQIQQSAV